MRKYDVTNFLTYHNHFYNYLTTDLKFINTKQEKSGLNFINEYIRDEIRIRFNYDFKENYFYFYLIKGKDTKFPNDKDNKNIISFYELFNKFEPNFNNDKIQPDDKQYIISLENNSILLKKYLIGILNGSIWI